MAWREGKVSEQLLEPPHVHLHRGVVRAETEEGEEIGRPCRMPCQAESSCFGQCTQPFAHSGPHDCSNDSSHMWGP